jgi:methyl-accepting chemotaxis protein
MRASIRLKLGMAFAVVIVLAAISTGFGIRSLAELNGAMDTVLQGPVERVQMADDLFADLLQALRAQKNMLLVADDEAQRTSYAAEGMRQRNAMARRAVSKKANGHAMPTEIAGIALDMRQGGGDSQDRQFVRY